MRVTKSNEKAYAARTGIWLKVSPNAVKLPCLHAKDKENVTDYWGELTEGLILSAR